MFARSQVTLDSELSSRAFSASTGKLFWDVGARSLGLVLTIVVARALGAQGYGSYAVAWYVAWMLAQLTDLGLHLVTLRALSRAWSNRVFASALAAKALLSFVLAAGIFTFASLPSATAGMRIVTILFLAHLMGSWTEWIGVILRSRGRIAREGAALATLRAGWVVAALAAAWSDSGLATLAGALAVGSLPALLAAVALLRTELGEDWGRPDARQIRRLLAEALPLALTATLTLVYLRADLLILAALRDAREAGIFAAAFRLFEAAFVFSGAIVAGAFPLLSARFGQTGFAPLARFVLTLLLSTGVPIAIAFATLAEPLVVLVYGDGFGRAAAPLSVLGFALIAVFVNALSTHLLIASGRYRRLVVCMLLRLGVAVTLDIVLIPVWGALGAAIAVTVAELSLSVASLASVTDVVRPATLLRSTPVPFLAGAALALVLLELPAALALKLAAGTAVYGLGVAAGWRWAGLPPLRTLGSWGAAYGAPALGPPSWQQESATWEGRS